MPVINPKMKYVFTAVLVFFCLSASAAFAANPVAGTVVPTNSSSPGERFASFTTTYSDTDGWRDIKYIYLLVSPALEQKANCFYARYEPATNKLYLRDDADGAWLGGFTAGSNNLIENSNSVLDCSRVTAIPRSSNNSITVRWSIKFKNAFAGAKNIYLLVSDRANNESGWKSAGALVVLRSDTTPPDAPRVTDGGVFTTSAAQLHASWSAQDPESSIIEYQYQIFEDATTGRAVLADWTSTGTAPDVLKSGLSLSVGKAYYFGVKAKNGAGLWSNVGYSDGIRVVLPDTRAPTGTIQINDGSSYVNSPQVTLTLTADDNEAEGGSGTDKMKISNNVDGSDGVEEPFSATKSWRLANPQLNGVKRVYVRFSDKAGNWPVAAIPSRQVLLDATKPTAPVVNDGGVANSAIELSVTWTDSTAASGIKEYQYAIFYMPSPSLAPIVIKDWTSVGRNTQATATGLSLTSGRRYYFGVRAKGNSGLFSDTAYSQGVTVDAPDNIPPTGTIQINGGAQYANSVEVVLNLTWQDNPGSPGVDKMKFSYTGLEDDWLEEEDVSSTKDWAFPIGDGTKTAYVKFRDKAGNWSQAYSASISLDTVAPTGSVTIAEKPYARSGNVTLNFTATDNPEGSGVVQMFIMNEDLSGLDDCVPYSDTYDWTLSLSRDGEKSVYAVVLDRAGNYSEVFWDTTSLETSVPTTIISGVVKDWQLVPVTVTLTASDTGVGIDKTYYSIDGSEPANIYTGPFTISNEGTYTVKYYSTDKAGNAETVQATPDPVRIDTSVPTGSIRINSGTANTNTPSVTLNLMAADTGSGVTEMAITNAGLPWPDPEPFIETKPWTLEVRPDERPPLNVQKSVYVKFKDAAGRWSIVYVANINLNIPVPMIIATRPGNEAVFYEDERILIRPTIRDAHLAPSPIEYKFSVDGQVKQDWSQQNGYTWAPEANGAHTIKMETRDTAGEDSRQIEVYIFRRGISPPS